MDERQPARTSTARGFIIYDEFTDQRGSTVRVQESSSATDECVWIFCAIGDEGEDPHLTVEQATWLRDALGAFIDEHPR